MQVPKHSHDLHDHTVSCKIISCVSHILHGFQIALVIHSQLAPKTFFLLPGNPGIQGPQGITSVVYIKSYFNLFVDSSL